MLTVHTYCSVADFERSLAEKTDATDLAPLPRGAEVFWICNVTGDLSGMDSFRGNLPVRDIQQILAKHESICINTQVPDAPLLCKHLWITDSHSPRHEMFMPISLYFPTGEDLSRPPEPTTNERGELRLGDFFSGAGGSSLGFSAAGFDTVMGIDKNREACATWKV